MPMNRVVRLEERPHKMSAPGRRILLVVAYYSYTPLGYVICYKNSVLYICRLGRFSIWHG